MSSSKRIAAVLTTVVAAAAMMFAGSLPAWANGSDGGAVLVVDDANMYAFVGWHGTYEFPTPQAQPWTIFLDVVNWAAGGGVTTDLDLLLFTTDGTSNPDNPGNRDAGVIYNRLVAEGYNTALAAAVDITTMTDFSAYDAVIYPNLADYSAASVVADGVAFITMEPGQTDEMDIGTGVSVFDDWAHLFNVLDNTHPTTDTLSLGTLVFNNPVRTEAILAAGGGEVLINVVVPEPGTLMLLFSGFSGIVHLRRRRRKARLAMKSRSVVG